MPLHLYNTLTRRKEAFEPIDPSNVRMYVCGPTVYDFAHIGNARPVIVFDVLYRLLRHIYGPDHVTYVRNITDVDDKINARALRDHPDLPLNDAIRKVTETTANQFFADVKKLGCLEPTVQPRATDNIREMIAMIEALIARGHAYVAAGEVLFGVDSMPDYGALSQRRLEDQQAGARVAVEAHKRNPADFVLWKLSSPDEPGWDSPWGRGRPGWHIECSAMSSRYLGEVFDIHGGGLDLIFPHHENEIAQSRCAFGTSVMAKVWMHNGFLQVEGQKMSKSLGNFRTIAELLEKSPGDILRLQMLMTHYRQPIDWTWDNTEIARAELFGWSSLLRDLPDYQGSEVDSAVVSALGDDLNTPLALTALRQLYARARNGDVESGRSLAATLDFLGFRHFRSPGLFAESIGLLNVDQSARLVFSEEFRKLQASLANDEAGWLDQFRRRLADDSLSLEIEEDGKFITLVRPMSDSHSVENLIAARLEARKAKNWAESDRIRDELAAMGIAIKDNKDGTTSWEVKR